MHAAYASKTAAIGPSMSSHAHSLLTTNQQLPSLKTFFFKRMREFGA